ncbi:MAG TPA: hypothetical protein IAC72_05135 [Candidatus Fimimonas merdipullorum]|uniref:Uncharacterized protein n=1 Tax=Candidatus Fimimonas merdipullorum TaxID=2840822 RepID=A0A9D1SPW5_9BACT|nr:hypothetical protein [Candidatus Fimimonas merdipullorum]
MGGRGTFAKGNNVPYVYKTVGEIEGVPVLEGIGGIHSLPEESHSSEAYIKLKPSGIFHEMRIYDKEHYLVKEIAYHPEPKLTGGKRRNILHIHEYDRSFKRSAARLLTQKEFNLFQKYFIGVNNDQR